MARVDELKLKEFSIPELQGLVKGGHLPGGEAVDLFYDGSDFVRLAEPRIETPHTHGTGCTYSAAITALLTRGKTLVEAVRVAKDYISRAISGAPGIGHGPVDHLAWRSALLDPAPGSNA